MKPFVNEKFSGITIEWSSTIGFGEYTLYKESGDEKWYGDSECMDRGEDKEFIKELLRLFVEKLIV